MSEPTAASIEASYAECQRLTRHAATNFYYSFLVLPRPKRRAMCALYAFLRHTDDLADADAADDSPASVAARRESLAQWRVQLDRALAGPGDPPLLPALADTVRQFGVPIEYLHAAIDGVLRDLDHTGFATFDELADYCYHVASVVGLACIHIWGFDGPAALEPARQCGIAFQLTNILRDLKEDADRGRIYLPREDLERFGYTLADLHSGVRDDRFRRLMHFEIDRAEQFYRAAAELDRHLQSDGRAVFGAMTGIYHGLLDEIRRVDGDVLSQRVGLSTWRKLGIVARWFLLLHAPPRDKKPLNPEPR